MKGKYIICCKELVEFQKFFFSIGGYWEGGDRYRIVSSGENGWLRLVDLCIKACGEPDKYLRNDYGHIDTSQYKFVNMDSFIRKIKLDKLKELEGLV